MTITFIGHLCRDINTIRGQSTAAPGGGVFHNGITAARMGAEHFVLSKCNTSDMQDAIRTLSAAQVRFHIDGSSTTTSIENVYPNGNPDDRQTRVVTLAPPFKESDLRAVPMDTVHVNPLWAGEFPLDLLKTVRRRATVLSGDAQGFLRHVKEDGTMCLELHEPDLENLSLFDVFKADLREATLLTGERDPVEAARKLQRFGPREIVLTHAGGLVVVADEEIFQESFGDYAMEARTGRGDTCTAAWLVARCRTEPEEAIRMTAEVTRHKLRYAGPFRGLGSGE
jgi:sugar/nucleoside kinase (ribokinase family)